MLILEIAGGKLFKNLSLILIFFPLISKADWLDDQATMYNFAMQVQAQEFSLQGTAQWLENQYNAILIQDQNPYIFYMPNDTTLEDGDIYYFNYSEIEDVDGSLSLYHNYVNCSNDEIEELSVNSYANYGQYYIGQTFFSDNPPWQPSYNYKNSEAMQEMVNMICNS